MQVNLVILEVPYICMYYTYIDSRDVPSQHKRYVAKTLQLYKIKKGQLASLG